MSEIKVELMTGTGQGIGRGCAVEMAKAGYKVSLMSPSHRSIEEGKGGKRREVPIRAELARLLAMHIGKRRADSLFISRQKRRDDNVRLYTRQRIGQMVRTVAREAEITKRLYPHLLRHTMATRLLAIGMDIADVQKFLGHDDIGSTRITPCNSCSVNDVATRTRRQIIGLIRSSRTLIWKIEPSAALNDRDGILRGGI